MRHFYWTLIRLEFSLHMVTNAIFTSTFIIGSIVWILSVLYSVVFLSFLFVLFPDFIVSLFSMFDSGIMSRRLDRIEALRVKRWHLNIMKKKKTESKQCSTNTQRALLPLCLNGAATAGATISTAPHRWFVNKNLKHNGRATWRKCK